MGHVPRFLDADTFAGRLVDAKNPVLIIGSGISLPYDGQPGVPSAAQMVVRARLAIEQTQWKRAERLARFDQAVSEASNRYQAAFQVLIEACGPKTANRVVHDAVLEAQDPSGNGTDKWHLSPGAIALGHYMASKDGVILTTNFDPLLEVAIRRAGGHCYRTVLDRDGSLTQITGAGTHLVHIHGFWQGNTLHTAAQLQAERLQLHASLTELLRDRSVFVMAYGGSDNALIKALRATVADSNAQTEVLWSFYPTDPTPAETTHVFNAFAAAAVEQVQWFVGVDVHQVFPQAISELPPTAPQPVTSARPTSPALKLWQGRLAALQEARAIETDAAVCFKLDHQIKEAEARIAAFEG